MNWKIFVIVWTCLFLVWLWQFAHAGERLQCFAQPQGRDWHYRTRVPGFNGDVKDDRCWYPGERMKPREELFWPSPEPIKLPDNVGDMQPPWQMEERWVDPKGWTHKE